MLVSLCTHKFLGRFNIRRRTRKQRLAITRLVTLIPQNMLIPSSLCLRHTNLVGRYEILSRTRRIHRWYRHQFVFFHISRQSRFGKCVWRIRQLGIEISRTWWWKWRSRNESFALFSSPFAPAPDAADYKSDEDDTAHYRAGEFGEVVGYLVAGSWTPLILLARSLDFEGGEEHTNAFGDWIK